MDFKSSRGIQEAQVWQAADALLAEGLRPTIERVRQKIGSGSPNTVSPMLERWFATLGKRLEGRVGSLADDEATNLPLAVVQAAQQFWGVALREAAQAQVQVSEASRRELELQQAALERKDASLQQRETAFEEARKLLADVDRERLASRQAAAELAKEQKLRASEHEASQRALAAERAHAREAVQAADKVRVDLTAASAAVAHTEAQFGASQRLLEDAATRLAQEQRSHEATRALLVSALAKVTPVEPTSSTARPRKPKPAAPSARTKTQSES